MRAARLALLVLVVVATVTACGGEPAPRSPVPALVPAPLGSGRTGWPQASLTHVVVPRVGPDPSGPLIRLDASGDASGIAAGRIITIVSDPVTGPDGAPWVHGWLEAGSAGTWPEGFVAWYPVAALQAVDPARCPATATLDEIAVLRPFDRERCAGGTELTFDARTGRLPSAPMYDTDPAWYGRNDDPGIALYDPGEVKIGPGAILSASEAGAWLEARTPPPVPALPVGFFVRVHGHYDDASAATCRRALPFAPPIVGLPVEAPADSAAWCRSQLVVSSWEPLLGPEGRPVDPAAPQLHRREFVPPPGVAFGCGGVGMPLLTVRIDPAAVDPVWIESGPGRRSIAVFADAFRIGLDPPSVVGPNGVTLLDRERLDPDRSKPGLSLCPGGDTIWFDVNR